MKKYVNSLVVLLMALFISSLSFTNVSAKSLDLHGNNSTFTKVEKNEIGQAFDQKNIQNALKKVDFNKNGVVQTVKLSDNYLLNVTVSSMASKNNIDNKNLMGSYITSNHTITKSVYMDATALLGWKVWSLSVAGTFGYNGSKSWVIDTNISPNTYMVGWDYTGATVKGVQVSSSEAKVIGSAKFYLGAKNVPIQNFTPSIAVGCNQNGGTITYSN